MTAMMEQCRSIERQGLDRILALLRRAKLNCVENKSLVGERDSIVIAQQQLGDLATWLPEFGAAHVEVKTEQNHTGNLFLETWSNLTPGWRRNPGWMVKIHPDFIAFPFINTGDIYIAKFASLWDWFYIQNNEHQYSRRDQRRHEQKNRTAGPVCPVNDIKRDIGLDHCRCEEIAGDNGKRGFLFKLISSDTRCGFLEIIAPRVEGMMTKL